MKILREFRDFTVRGNVVDLAVGIIIGAAFGKIVSSLVADVIMPVVGIFFGGVHYDNLFVQVGDARIMYGRFLQNVVDFVIIAAAIFFMVRLINRLRRKEEAKPPAAPPPRDVELLEEIRDLLKRR